MFYKLIEIQYDKKQSFNILNAKGRGMNLDLTFNDTMPKAPMVIFAHGFKAFKEYDACLRVMGVFS